MGSRKKSVAAGIAHDDPRRLRTDFDDVGIRHGPASYVQRGQITGTVPEGSKCRPALHARPNRGRQPTRADMPPSTGSNIPVMKLASSEAKNSAACAVSHAV